MRLSTCDSNQLEFFFEMIKLSTYMQGGIEKDQRSIIKSKFLIHRQPSIKTLFFDTQKTEEKRKKGEIKIYFLFVFYSQLKKK